MSASHAIGKWYNDKLAILILRQFILVVAKI